MSCTVNGGVVTPVRVEGFAEPVAHTMVTCTGGTATPQGSPIPFVTIQLFLNTSITSKILAGTWSEALLLVDEPAPAAQRVCGTTGDVESGPGVCTITGTGTGAGVYSGATGRPNVFQATQVASNLLQWTVPVDPPGVSGSRTFRFVNVRANANALGVAAPNAAPTSVVATVTAIPQSSLPIAGSASPVVGSVLRGQSFSVTTLRTFQQCKSENEALATNPGASGTSQLTLRFAELFATAFKKRNIGASAANPTALANQNDLTLGAYNTESDFYNSSFPSFSGRGNLALAGLADHGTRLIARFNNIPPNVLLFSQISGVAVSPFDQVRMVNTDINGAGPYSPVAGSSWGIAPIPVSNFTATAVYEFVQSDPPLTIGSVDISIFVAYLSSGGVVQPGVGAATVNAGYAPLSSTGAASATESVPRFANTSSAGDAFSILSCDCTTLGSNTASFASGGGSGTVNVTAGNACEWNPFSLDNWITVSPPGVRAGSSTLGYGVASNDTLFPRTGAIDIGSKIFTITQSGVPCTISISPAAAAFGPSGGAGSFNVFPNFSSCGWSATSNVSWVVITNPGVTQGSGTVNFSVAPNSGVPRSATITGFSQPFTIDQSGPPLPGLRFVPVTPCRVIDTRLAPGPFGGPASSAGSTRDIAIPNSACGIPSNAAAYSLNVTVVPPGPLAFLTLWPTGQPQPFVSTLNSFDGRIKANAAIVPAGVNGQVSWFVTHATHVVLDINGYFVPASGANDLAFYPVAPCRIADTRSPAGPLGGPSITGGQTRSFDIRSGSCGIPAAAQAYSLNLTAVPAGALAFLTTWSTGQPQPFVSTLNAFTGTVTANAAIVPAGVGGAISIFATNPTDLVIDINGYFAPPGSPGELLFYPVTPCRISDTRNPTGPFGGPAISAAQTRDYAVPASSCGLPATAKAYALNATVVPSSFLSYLTLSSAGVAPPLVSTLNSFDGSVVANAAIVRGNAAGSITAFVTHLTDLILDVNGYFAP